MGENRNSAVSTHGVTKLPSILNKKVIYAYTMPINHPGLIKVGDTTIKSDELSLVKGDHERLLLAREAAERRIRQDHKGAHAVELEYVLELALIIDKDPDNNFRDYKIHELLEYNGIERIKFGHTKAREWFRASPEQIKNTIDAYINGYRSIDRFLHKREIILREEQIRIRDNTLMSIKAGSTERLWDCKPRFGKTTTGISLLLESHSNTSFDSINSVLIVTNRPDVLDSWYSEYETMMDKDIWQFSSRSVGSKFEEIDKNRPHIVFMSLQDLKGKDDKAKNEYKKRNEVIFEHYWDLIIIDEAHEGNDTELADGVHNEIRRGFSLYLSGTPFKYLEKNRFSPDQIDTWDYIQEQYAKSNWDYTIADNPYKLQPQLWINAIDLSVETKELFTRGDDASAFDFNEFFKLDDNGVFMYKKYISELLQRLQGEDNQSKNISDSVDYKLDEPQMPYSRSFRTNTNHTLWVLPPNVKACTALGDLLRNDSFFKDYTIVVAAGSDSTESKNALKSVKTAIKNNNKTITLTVGKLTTGVTVPEWTGILMLTNMSSASMYMQTIFRCQSPYEYCGNIKENSFIWDFAPDRVLSIVSEVAGLSSKASIINSNPQKAKLNEMLNFMPIIAYTKSGDMQKLAASDISIKLKAFYAERAINSGFETPVLFRKDLENVSEDMRRAILDLFLATGASARLKEPKWEVIISSTGSSEPIYDEDGNEEPSEPKILTPKELEARNLRLEILKERKNLTNILYAVSSRIPYILLAKMSDVEFREKLKLDSNFGFKNLADSFDEESWKEFFGSISKELFICLEEAFDMDTTRGAILTWVNNVQETLEMLSLDPIKYSSNVYKFMKQIKNPNKETVFTPVDVVKKVYGKAGFNDISDWERAFIQIKSGNGENTVSPTFYDINVKSGLFPMEAFINLYISSNTDDCVSLCRDHIFANARTLAGKWATCSLLGQESTWDNITVIDIHFWLQCDELDSISEDGRKQFLAHFLLSPLNNMFKSSKLIADIEDNVERMRTISIIKDYELKRNAILKSIKGKVGEMSNEQIDKLTSIEKELIKDLEIESQFDYTISNPPYQMSVSERSGQDDVIINIFQEFWDLSISISNQVSMIFPGGRWMQRSKGCEKIANSIFATADSIDWFPNGDEKGIQKIFENVRIPDGIAIVNGRKIPKDVKSIILNGSPINRPLSTSKDILPLQGEMGSLIAKVNLFQKFLIGNKKSRTFFGILSSYVEKNPTKVELIDGTKNDSKPYNMAKPIKAWLGNEVPGKAKQVKEYWIDKDSLNWDNEKELMLKKWKVTGSQGGMSKTPHTIDYKVIDNKHIVGETYLIVNSFNTKEEAYNFQKYLKTKTVRRLLEASKAGKIGQWGRFVPDLQDYSTNNVIIDWSEKKESLDDQLVLLFDFTPEDILFINKGN